MALNKNVFQHALDKININVIDLKKTPDFIYPSYSYFDSELKNYIINEMVSNKENIEKKYILNTQQHIKRYSPEIYILNNKYCYYISFDYGIKIFNSDMALISEFNPYSKDSTNTFYTKQSNPFIMPLGNFDFCHDNKSTLKILDSIKIFTNLNFSEKKLNFYKPSKNKHYIKSIELKENIIVHFEKSLYQSILFDDNFNIEKVIFGHDINKKSNNLIPLEISNIKSKENFLNKINDKIDMYKMISDENINIDTISNNLTIQIKNIKLIVKNFDFIKQKSIELEQMCSKLDFDLSFYDLFKQKNINNKFHYEPESLSFLNNIEADIINKIYNIKIHHHKKIHMISSLFFIEYINNNNLSIINEKFLNNIQNIIKESNSITSKIQHTDILLNNDKKL